MATVTAALLTARYGRGPDRDPTPAGAVIDSLLGHRSVRAFLPSALPEHTLTLLMAAAQSAATSANLQAWSVVAVEDPARKARLSQLAGDQAHIRACPLFLAWIADLSRLDRVSARQGGQARANDFLEMFLVAVVDAALAAQNAVVAAESLGLGTVYIGAMRNRPEEVAAELALPPDAFAVFGLCVGRPDPARPASVKPRLAQAAMLHRERYGSGQVEDTSETAAIGDYDAAIKAFQAAQSLPPSGWVGPAAARVRDAASLSGRHRLREALTNLGFRLT